MKNKCKIIVIVLLIATLTGCSKYEEDTSYTTDLYGVYSKNIEAFASDDVNQITEETSISYSLNETYKFNADNSYQHIKIEIIYDEVTQDVDKTGKIISIEDMSNDISKITLDQVVTEWSTGKSSNQVVYKYNNMIGSFYEIEVPNGKTFELRLNDTAWYDKEGQYHLCDGNDNCDCSNSSPKYIRKNNIIYFQSMNEEYKNFYTINAYIVDDGLFFPELYKAE